MKKIAIFGSAFNPPHRGHAHALSYLMKEYDLVFAVPSASHAFGKRMANFDLRCEALNILIEQENLFNVKVSKVESDLLLGKDSEPVYTIEVLEYFRHEYPDAVIHFALGPDNADPQVFQKFRFSERIDKEYGLVVVPETLGFRSTYAREALKKNDIEASQRILGEDVYSFCFETKAWESL